MIQEDQTFSFEDFENTTDLIVSNMEEEYLDNENLVEYCVDPASILGDIEETIARDFIESIDPVSSIEELECNIFDSYNDSIDEETTLSED
ncbi:MAG: hypothetical protein NC116_09640 [Clostridium sp.]|nr:hypothetical protein [Clostridium sp.]